MIIDFYSIRKDLIEKQKIKHCKKSGNTLLHLLINDGDLEGFKNYSCIIRELINNKKLINKIINAQNFNGDTPAHIAVRKSNRKNNIYSAMVEILQELGADFTISNNNNEVITKLDDGDNNNEQIKQDIRKCLFNNQNNDTELLTVSIVPETITIDKPNYYKPNYKPDYNKPDYNKPNYYKPDNNKALFEIFTNSPINNNNNNNKTMNYSTTSPFNLNGKQIFYNNNLNGGNQLSSNIEDNLNYVDKLSTSPNIENNLYGGAKYSESSESDSSNSNSNSMIYGKRNINNPYIKGGSKKAQKIHNDIIEHIQKLGYNEQEAKDIKNVLYYEVKDKYPSLTNTEKAEKMLELVDKKVKNINMKDVHKILEEKRENRNKDTKETKKPKEAKKTSKKTSKRVNKNK
jgi:hypothetical protein